MQVCVREWLCICECGLFSVCVSAFISESIFLSETQTPQINETRRQ